MPPKHLGVLLRVLFSRFGLDAEIYEGAFDAAEGEARNPQSGLYKHDPEIVVVLSSVQALRDKFYQRAGSAAAFREETLQRLAGVWDALRAHS